MIKNHYQKFHEILTINNYLITLKQHQISLDRVWFHPQRLGSSQGCHAPEQWISKPHWNCRLLRQRSHSNPYTSICIALLGKSKGLTTLRFNFNGHRRQITIQPIPAHINILKNKIADYVAKQGCSSNTSCKLHIYLLANKTHGPILIYPT